MLSGTVICHPLSFNLICYLYQIYSGVGKRCDFIYWGQCLNAKLNVREMYKFVKEYACS